MRTVDDDDDDDDDSLECLTTYAGFELSSVCIRFLVSGQLKASIIPQTCTNISQICFGPVELSCVRFPRGSSGCAQLTEISATNAAKRSYSPWRGIC